MSNDYSELIERLREGGCDDTLNGLVDDTKRIRLSEREAVAAIQTLVMEAADALTAQAREIEALRADAERYRWLRDEDDDPCVSLPQLFTETGKPEDVDAAIDAAMQSGKAVTP